MSRLYSYLSQVSFRYGDADIIFEKVDISANAESRIAVVRHKVINE